MAGVELGTAYLSLIASTRGLAASVRQGVRLTEPVAEEGGKKAGSKFSGALKLAAVAGVAAAGALVAKSFGDAIEREKLGDKTAAALGLNGKQSATAGKVAGQLYAGAWGGSMEEVNGAVESVMSSIKGMTKASPGQLKRVTAAALDIATAFDVDVDQAATNAGILMKQGLAPNATAAMDLITAGLQKVPKALRGEVMDATEEYSQFFASLGYTGKESMGLLVSATEDGQYGIDKLGDAVKEFTIRSTDMSKSTQAAYDTLGLDSGKMTAQLLAGGDKAKGAFDKIVTGIKGIKDPAEQSQTALALFGTPLEDLGTKDIPKFLDSLTSGKTALKDTKGAAKEMGDTLNDNLGTRLEGWKRSVQVFASDGLMSMIQGFESGKVSGEGFQGVMSRVGTVIRNVTDWVMDNKTLVLTLVGAWGAWKLAVLAHAGAMKVAALGTKVWAAATKGAAVAQRILNLAMKANPIGLIITAIGLLVGALVWFFTKTKLGKKIIEVAWKGIKTAIKAVADWWTKTAWPAIKKVITAFQVGFQVAKKAIGVAWAGIKTAAGNAWAWIKKWVFLPFRIYIGAWKLAFKTAKTVITTAWTGIRKGLGAGWAWIRDNVFAKLKSGVGAIKTAFSNVKDGIKTAWDKLKAIAAKPVNFILGTVYNDGIAHWWNTIVNGLKLPQGLKLPAAKLLKYAQGGVLPGYTPGRDVHEFYSPTAGRLSLSGGEAIMRPEFTRAVGGAAGVARLNAMARRGQAFAGGGIFNWAGDKWSKIWRGGVNLAGDVWDKAKKLGGDVWNFVKDPVGSITKGLGAKVKSWLGGLPGGEIAAAFGTMPGKLVGGLADTVKKHFTATDGGTVKTGSGGSRGMGVAAMTRALRALIPGAVVTSGFRGGARTVTGYPSYHGLGRAIDIVPGSSGLSMGAIWDRLMANYGKVAPEIFYSGRNFSRFGKLGRKRNDHWDHVHWAMKNGGVLPKLYDQGGWLPQGLSVVENRTGKPEPVLTNDQWDRVTSQNQAPLIGQLVVRDEKVAVREFRREQQRQRVRNNMAGRS